MTRSTGGSVDTRYEWDVNNPLPELAIERTNAGDVARRYVQGPAGVMSMAVATGQFSADDVFDYLRDPLGSVVDVTDAVGASLQLYSYEPFGAPLQSPAPAVSAPQNRFEFAGEYTDATGDVYLRARQYDPITGRFAGTDPVTPGAASPWMSLYAYVGNQPGVLVDPSGMVSCPSLPVGASRGQVASWRSCLHTESDQEAATAAEDTFVNRLAASRDATLGAVTSTATAPVRAIAHPKRTANGFKNYVQEGWSRDGLRGVVNNFNPIYLGLTHGEQARQALADGDPAAAAQAILNFTMDAEALIGCAGGAARLARPGEAGAVNPVGFAPGEGSSALTANRLQHGTRHLADQGLLPAWSGENSPGIIREALTPILENPTATFDHVLGGTPVKGFVGEIGGKRVAVMFFKGGKHQGELATSVVPSAAQLAKWGVR